MLAPMGYADPASWDGQYAITFIVGPKDGTSIAAGQSEVQYTDTYTFSSTSATGKCIATIIGGPPPRTRPFRNRFNSPGMGRHGHKPAISSGSA
jgi:hypothetical protein